jgi:Domain of unknown function (DUF4296)
MRKAIAGLLAIFCLIAAGCSDNKSVPSGILPREKMENVLWDMIQADQYASVLERDSAAHIADLKAERLRLYDQVFRLHDVSRDKFRKSYQYYSDHPELSQDLFDSLLVRGNKLRSEQYAHPAPRPSGKPPTNPLSPPFKRPPAVLPANRPPDIQPANRPKMPSAIHHSPNPPKTNLPSVLAPNKKMV